MSTEKTHKIIYTSKAKCRDCNRCVLHCPVKAIKIGNGQAQVISDRCIACGTCVLECPQNAKSYRDDIDKVENYISRGSKLAISVAPAFAALYNEWQQKRLPSALRTLGFSHISETAVGAYYCAMLSKKVIENEPSKTHILTACPATVNYFEKYKPNLVDNLVKVASPMIIHAKLMHEKLPDNYKIIFVGPCIAKKDEADRHEHKNLIDAVLTFDELEQMFKNKNIDFSKLEESNFDDEPGLNSRFFPIEGGLLRTANLNTDILSSKILAISGFDELREMAETIEKSSETYIVEPLFCNYGCINGPGISHNKPKFESRNSIIKYSEKKKGKINLEEFDLKKFSTSFNNSAYIEVPKFTDSEIRKTLAKFGKHTPEDELNCSACGYNSCYDKAVAVLQGIAEYEMCVPYMKRLAEAKSDQLIETSPNGIVVLNEKLEIESINKSFKKMFSCSDAILKKKISYLIDPDPFEKIALGDLDKIVKDIRYQNYNLICHQITYAMRQEKKYIGIFVDITASQNNKKKLNELKNETIDQAQELIEHQVNMAQELARFLGNNTAKGEMLMNNLIEAIKKD